MVGGRRTERNEYWFQLEGVEKSEVSGEKILRVRAIIKNQRRNTEHVATTGIHVENELKILRIYTVIIDATYFPYPRVVPIHVRSFGTTSNKQHSRTEYAIYPLHH